MLTRLSTWLENDTTLRAHWIDPKTIRWYIGVIQSASLENEDAVHRCKGMVLPWESCQRRIPPEQDKDGFLPGDCATFDGEILLDTCSRVRSPLSLWA